MFTGSSSGQPFELKLIFLSPGLTGRHVNKEKQAIPEWAKKKEGGGEKFRTKDVAYWYIDYREMANVVKYRIAMMRKAVEEKLNSVHRKQNGKTPG